MTRQIILALFDLRIHQDKTQSWPDILAELKAQLSILPMTEYDRFAHSFGHIFSGGYAAGYYSYIWAEILSADAYAAFVEEDDRTYTGRRFWQELLSRGGSRSAAVCFKAFRGRKPRIEPFLQQLGLQHPRGV